LCRHLHQFLCDAIMGQIGPKMNGVVMEQGGAVRR
jgi:hypothetical protein